MSNCFTGPPGTVKAKDPAAESAVAVTPAGVVKSPHERSTDSPQVATLYGSHLLFYETPPPGFRPRLLTTPPHASPEPPLSTDTLYR